MIPFCLLEEYIIQILTKHTDTNAVPSSSNLRLAVAFCELGYTCKCGAQCKTSHACLCFMHLKLLCIKVVLIRAPQYPSLEDLYSFIGFKASHPATWLE